MTPRLDQQKQQLSILVAQMEDIMPKRIHDEFITALRLELQSITFYSIICGQIPTASIFASIKRSLKKVHKSASSRGEPFPWEQLCGIILTSYEKLLSEQTHGKAPKASTVQSTQMENASQPANSHNPAFTPPSSAAVKDFKMTVFKPLNPVVPKPPVEDVLRELNHYATSSKLYTRPGHQYIECTRNTCYFCTAMFEHVTITPCSQYGHANCIPVGWFPHVGISMWNELRSQHDMGMRFIPRVIDIKDTELPPLYQLRQLEQSQSRDRLTTLPAKPVSSSLWADEI